MSAEDLALPRSGRVLLTDLGIDAVEVARRAGLADRALDGGLELTVDQYFSLWNALESSAPTPPSASRGRSRPTTSTRSSSRPSAAHTSKRRSPSSPDGSARRDTPSTRRTTPMTRS